MSNSALSVQTHSKTFLYGAALVVLVIFIESIQNQNLFWGPLHDSAHAFAFFLLCLTFFSILESREKDAGFGIFLVAGICFTAGILLELVQPIFERDSSFTDIYYNFVGIMSALAIRMSKHLHIGRKILARSIASLVLMSALFVPLSGAYTLHQQNLKRPVLLDLEDAWQYRIYRGGDSAILSQASGVKGWNNQTTALRIDFSTKKYPGFSIPHVETDWRGYNRLELEIFSKEPSEKPITLRVHDAAHNQEYSDRFNQRFLIKPGENHLSIPLDQIEEAPKGRSMDLSQISGMAFFSVSPEEEFTLYFDNITLK